MSGWDSWAANVKAASTVDGCAIYDPAGGSIWGKSGNFACSGQLNVYDNKANGKEGNAPEINGQKYMFIRKTQDDDPVSVFKKGQDSMFTLKGPSNSRVAVCVKSVKPEPVIAAVVSYLAPHT